ncbi:MAG TPA: DUF222 domain-containing protein [Acidimicrobiales bacterium]|nr:DUF222 domain-containing protein [Acidimicrobiales bacterium]
MDGVDLLAEGNEALAGVDLDAVGDGELGGMLVALQREQAKLAANQIRVMGAFEARRAHATDGSKTAAAWMARATRCAPTEARALVRHGRRLPHMPTTREALAEGQISERHAAVLGGLHASGRKPIAEAFAGAEVMLVGYAKELSFDDFLAAVRYWEKLVDADGAEDRAADDHAARRFHMSETWRGNWAADGQFDPLAGEEVHAELSRLEQELFRADWEEAKALHGENTCLEHLVRTPAQRRADALVVMARRSAAKSADAVEPRLLIVAHLGDESLSRMCELASGRVITPGQLVPRLGDADIQRIVYAGPSRRITDLGERTRFFTGPLREAILLRDRHCQHPGCRVPAHACQVDHIVPRSKGGLTVQGNGQARCDHHNRHKSDTHPDHYAGHATGWEPPLRDTG